MFVNQPAKAPHLATILEKLDNGVVVNRVREIAHVKLFTAWRLGRLWFGLAPPTPIATASSCSNWGPNVAWTWWTVVDLERSALKLCAVHGNSDGGGFGILHLQKRATIKLLGNFVLLPFNKGDARDVRTQSLLCHVKLEIATKQSRNTIGIGPQILGIQRLVAPRLLTILPQLLHAAAALANILLLLLHLLPLHLFSNLVFTLLALLALLISSPRVPAIIVIIAILLLALLFAGIGNIVQHEVFFARTLFLLLLLLLHPLFATRHRNRDLCDVKELLVEEKMDMVLNGGKCTHACARSRVVLTALVALCLLTEVSSFAGRRTVGRITAPRTRAWAVAKGNDDEVASLVKAIMSAVDEGREDDLKKAGLKVTRKSELERLRDNLSNEQILEQVLGPMTGAEEREVLSVLEKTTKEMGMGVVGFDDQDTGVDESLLAQFRQEAAQAYRNLNMEAPQASAPATAGGGRGVEQILTITSKVSLGAGDAPPSQSTMRELEIDPSEFEIAEVAEGEVMEKEKQQLTTTVGQRVGGLENSMAAIEAEEGLSDSDGSRELAQQTFAQLLKASMDATEDRAGQTEEETVKQTLEAVSSGDFAALDVKSLLGETLGTLAEQMGIDVRSELVGNGKAQQDLQAIMTSSMAELATNMAALDEQSQQLYQKLGNLEEELRKDSEAFDRQKSSELEELLGRQTSLQKDIDYSRDRVQATSQQLEKLMSDLDEKADVLTSLALFPIKSTDKKVAFVFGLALLFKVPFDALKLFNIRTLDPSDLLGLVTQAGLCLAFFNHYGLVKAFFQPKTSFAGLPPPPSQNP